MKKLKLGILSILFCGCTSTQTYQTITACEAKKMMDNQNVVVIDVREKDEYVLGHIPQAIHIPLGTINENNTALPNKDQTILVYCRSGKRSKKAAKKLAKLGYLHIYDFGGILDWTYELER